jgi:hypothetical protein
LAALKQGGQSGPGEKTQKSRATLRTRGEGGANRCQCISRSRRKVGAAPIADGAGG